MSSKVPHRTLLVVIAVVVAVVSASCSAGKDGSASTTTAKGPTDTAAPARSAKMSPTQVLDADLGYSDFNRIVAVSGLGDELDGMKHLTLIVPSNTAIGTLAKGRMERLLADQEAAAAFVKSRTIGEELSVTDMLNRTEPIVDEANSVWKVEVVDGQPTLGGAGFGPRDIPMRNGYLHVIESPGLPSES